jgi:hypothetical protein
MTAEKTSQRAKQNKAKAKKKKDFALPQLDPVSV